MTVGEVTDLASSAMFLIIRVSAPVLLVSLCVGLIVSIFQTVTSIQEQTLTFVPKIIAVFLGMMLLGGWMLENLTDFMAELWNNFGLYLR